MTPTRMLSSPWWAAVYVVIVAPFLPGVLIHPDRAPLLIVMVSLATTQELLRYQLRLVERELAEQTGTRPGLNRTRKRGRS